MSWMFPVRYAHPSRRTFRVVYGIAVLASCAFGISSGESVLVWISPVVCAIILMPTLLLARTWVEATQDGLAIQNPMRQIFIAWDDTMEIRIAWFQFSRTGQLLLTSGDYVWIHAINAGNGLSRSMTETADATVQNLLRLRRVAGQSKPEPPTTEAPS